MSPYTEAERCDTDRQTDDTMILIANHTMFVPTHKP